MQRICHSFPQKDKHLAKFECLTYNYFITNFSKNKDVINRKVMIQF